MSGILYVVMAILVILVVTTLMLWNKANKEWVNSELDRLQDLRTFEMHLDAKDQQIADIRRETEDEMRRLFKDLVDSLHSEIDELCEEKSKLQRTINLQGAQLEELEDQKGALQYFEERSIAIVAERVQECLEGAKAPLKEEIAELRLRIDKLCEERSKLQRTVRLQNPRARKLVELQRVENQKVAKSEEDLARTRDIEEQLAVIEEQIDATPEGPAGQVALKDLYRRKEGLFWQLGQIEIRYYEGGE